MEAPQIIIICLASMSAGFAVADGAKSTEDAKMAVLRLAGLATTVALLWWGGFWS